MPFVSLGLTPALCTPLARLGYTAPTPVQTESIPIVLSGRDLLARAQTGTGKTAAFGLPMIDRLLLRSGQAGAAQTPPPAPPARAGQAPRAGHGPRAGQGFRPGGVPKGQPRRPRGLVLLPTRELALQVQTSLADYGRPVHLRVTAIFGGVPIRGQVQALQRGVDIIVATPGRLIDHMQQGTVDLAGIEILTLDEADRMLDMGFLPALRRILGVLPRERQTLLFSATFSKEVVRLSADFTRDPARVDVSDGQVVAATVTHRVHPVSDGRKASLLTHLLRQEAGAPEPRQSAQPEQALVFCKTKRGSNRVGAYLEQAGVRAAVIHGNKSQSARTRALGDFKAGRVAVLVATDIAARGLDIVQLPLVINYDLPLVPEDYIHRIGRTGRAGVPGRAVSLVSAADRPLLREIQRLLPDPLEQVVIEGFDAPAAAPAAGHGPSSRPRGGHAAGPRAGGGHDARPRAASHGGRPRTADGHRPAAHGQGAGPQAGGPHAPASRDGARRFRPAAPGRDSRDARGGHGDRRTGGRPGGPAAGRTGSQSGPRPRRPRV